MDYKFDMNDLRGHTTRTTMIKKGLYEKEKQKVICPNCNKHILDIVTVDDAEIKLSHQIICPCGETSFKFHTDGNYVYDYGDKPFFSADIQMEDGLVTLTVKER